MSKSTLNQHPDTPIRNHMADPSIQWRTGSRPNYDTVNLKYLKERSRFHSASSLEKLVENIVKTWEMESTHKINPKDWKTVDVERYNLRTNGGSPKNLEDTIKDGNYILIMDESPLFDVKKETNESTHVLFKTAFPGGFAWELLDLFSGPPKITFTWRHWAHWTGPYGIHPPTGELMELIGSAVVLVDDQLKITDLYVFFDPNPMIAKMMNFKLTPDQCPFASSL